MGSDWLDRYLEPTAAESTRSVLSSVSADPLKFAEHLAIRFALHDAGATPAVNSQYSGAWNQSRGKGVLVDDLAWALAQRLHALESAPAAPVR